MTTYTTGDSQSTTIRFNKSSRDLLDAVFDILPDQQPMTLRGLYYRCVSAGVLEATTAGYARLKTMARRLRESGDIPRRWIVDHVRRTLKPSSWSGLGDFGQTVREAYRKDFWASLDTCVEVIVEKDAVAATLQPITERYDIALRVCRGYTSISFSGEIADEWRQIEKPIFAFYLGDFDASGFDIERDLQEKLIRYGAGEFHWRRLAVRGEHFDEFNLLKLSPKTSDRRTAKFIEKHGTACAELDAIPPDDLRDMLEDAILEHINIKQWNRLQEIENIEKQTMQEYLDEWP